MKRDSETVAKARYRILYMIIEAVLARHDPIGLLGFCPRDEYDPEIRDLIQRLLVANTPDRMCASVYSVFAQWFGENTAGPEERYRELGKELWDSMPRWVCRAIRDDNQRPARKSWDGKNE